VIDQTDIAVYKDDTLLALTSGYTVSLNADGTGSVTTVASMTGFTVTIVGARAYERISDYSTGGDFFADTVNDELDSFIILLQQLRETLARTLKLPTTTLLSGDAAFPEPEANQFIAWNSTGTGLVNVIALTTGVLAVSSYIETLLNDATAAEARTTLGAVGLTGNETVAGNKTLTGALAGTTAAFSGAVSGTTGTFSGAVSGNAAMLSPITNSLGADVLLDNTANYFDGPSVAQGLVGTWFVSGTVNVIDTAGLAAFVAKLWDGATVIASAALTINAANIIGAISLSGYISAPAGNLRISVKDGTSTSGRMESNGSGNEKDCTITAIRIG